MAAKESSETRDSSMAGKPYIKSRTSDLPILVLFVLLTGVIICWSGWSDLLTEPQSEMSELKNKLGELTKELKKMKYDYEHEIKTLQETYGNGLYGHDGTCFNKLDKLKEGRGQQAKHLSGVSAHLTESAAQLQKSADMLADVGFILLSGDWSRGYNNGHIKKALQQVASALNDVQNNLNTVMENLIHVGKNMKQQKAEDTHAEIRRTNYHNSDPCEVNGTLKGEMKILEEYFTNQLREVNSKHQSDIGGIKHKLGRLEWLLVCVCTTCLVCFMYMVFIYTRGSGRPHRAVSVGPSGLPLHMVTVVTFTRETYERSQTALPQMLGQSAPTPREVNYKLMTGELDLSQIPSSCGYIVVIGYDARNSILEDMDGSMGSRKRLTIVGLQNTKHDVLVIYIENDPQMKEPPADSLYNTHLGRPSSHPILQQLVDNQCFLTLPNWKYTQHQAEHVRKWVRSL